MELENKVLQFFEETENSHAHFTVNGDECAALYRISNGVGRRMIAAWNYCEGVPTAELESKGADAGFWGRACSRLETKNDKLQEENSALRAAVREMKRMLPLIEIIEGDYEDIWNMATKGRGIATLNAYRQTLTNALAKINEK